MYGTVLPLLLLVDQMLDSKVREQIVEGEDSCDD